MNRNRLNWTLKSTFFTLFLAFSTPGAADGASAGMGANFQLGGLAGVGIFSGANGNNVALGVQADYMFRPNLNAGLLFMVSPLAPAAGVTSNMYFFLPETSYYLTDLIPGLYVGAKAGIGIQSLTYPAPFAGSSQTFVLVGPTMGLDIPIAASTFTVGAQSYYLLGIGSAGTLSVLNILGTVKIWF